MGLVGVIGLGVNFALVTLVEAVLGGGVRGTL